MVLRSTSRNELWRKGTTSGDVLELAEIRVNCEQNSLLYLVRRTTGGACHTVAPSGSSAWLPLPWPNGNVGAVNTGMASCRGQIGDPVTG